MQPKRLTINVSTKSAQHFIPSWLWTPAGAKKAWKQKKHIWWTTNDMYPPQFDGHCRPFASSEGYPRLRAFHKHRHASSKPTGRFSRNLVTPAQLGCILALFSRSFAIKALTLVCAAVIQVAIIAGGHRTTQKSRCKRF